MRTHRGFKNLILFGMIILVSLGAYLRLSNLDGKAYWLDEAYTSLWISGYSREEMGASIPDAQIVSFADLEKFHGGLEDRQGILATVNRLAVDDTQHPPLYYGLSYIWTQVNGASVTSYRSLSALIGVLALIATYFLGLQLFESQLHAAVLSSIVAVSPFHLVWSQEARQYSLWILAIILSSALFLKCLKCPDPRWPWVAYTLTLTLGLYTHAFMSLIVGVHIIYFLSVKRIRSNRKSLVSFTLCLLLAYLLFSPWAILLAQNGFDAAGWTAEPVARLAYFKSFVLNILRTFVDVGFELNAFFYFAGIITSAILVYSAVKLVQNLQKNSYLFIFYLCLVPIMPLLLADITMGGQRALISRYFVSSSIGLELLVTAVITENLRSSLSKLTVACVIVFGLLSCHFFVQSDSWWNKYRFNDTLPVAQIINQQDNPLVITDGNISPVGTLSISYDITPAASLIRKPDQAMLSKVLCSKYDTFALSVSKPLIRQLTDKGYEVSSEFMGNLKLWKVSCNRSQEARESSSNISGK